MKKMLLSATAILLLSALAACSEGDSEDTNAAIEERIVAVEVEEAATGTLTIERSVYGRTAANTTTPILIQTPGELDTLEVKNGDQVEEDDIIAKIATPMGKQNIRAPKDGEILNLTASEGDYVSNEQPFALIADLETMKLNFAVTADVRKLFSIDKKLTAIITDEEYEATITSISTMPDDTGLYPIEATVANKNKAILPGMVVELFVPEQQVKDALLVPTAAIIEGNDETYVYVIEENKAVKQVITVVETQSAQSAIEGEVQEGDELVITGQLTLSDGVQVNVVKGE